MKAMPLGLHRSPAEICNQGVQTVTSLPHTQHDVLWTASCLEPVLEDDGAADPEEEVSCTRKIDNTVDDIDLLQSSDDSNDIDDADSSRELSFLVNCDDEDSEMTMIAAMMILMTTIAAMMISTTMMSITNDVRNNKTRKRNAARRKMMKQKLQLDVTIDEDDDVVSPKTLGMGCNGKCLEGKQP